MHALNPETLVSFGDFMNPEELRDFLGRVQQELDGDWPRLEAAWMAQDWQAVQHGAHRLKSVVGSVGCDLLCQALNQLENELRAQPARQPEEARLAQLRALVVQARQDLRAASAG